MSKTETGQLLTRHVDKSRADTANRLSNLLTREYKIAVGEIDATPSQVNALRNQILRILPNVNPEDFAQVTNEVRSTEETGDDIVSVITDEDILQLAVNHDLNACIKARDMLNRLIPDGDVVSLSKAG